MSDIKISLDSAGPKGEISVVRVDGVIDTMTSSDLEKVMNSLLERGKYYIVIDLGGVDYISSAGWGIFISNIREIRQHSGDIKLARMIPNVYEIFELLEFDSILKAFDSVEKAKSDFSFIKRNGADSGERVPVEVAVAALDSAEPTQKIKEVANPSTNLQDAPKQLSQLEKKSTAPGLQEIVVEMVIKDPFFSISEIKTEIARKYPTAQSGWWQIWNVLRQNRLLSKKSRFRLSRFKSGVR